jgi:hypothetical protein
MKEYIYAFDVMTDETNELYQSRNRYRSIGEIIYDIYKLKLELENPEKRYMFIIWKCESPDENTPFKRKGIIRVI